MIAPVTYTSYLPHHFISKVDLLKRNFREADFKKVSYNKEQMFVVLGVISAVSVIWRENNG
jgi:hypothetical protein